MIKLCIPASITILVMTIYSVADMYFIGKLNDPLQVAAISLTMPLNSILSAIGTLIGGGACTAIAINLGKKEFDIVKKMTSFSTYLSLAIGFVFLFIIYLFHDAILNFIGTSSDTYEFAKKYMLTFFLGAPIILIGNVFSNIIRATGSAKDAMFGNLLGTICNILLDYIFILHFNLGIFGAALATVISNIFAFIYYFRFLLKNNTDFFSIHIKDFTLAKEVSINILSLGLPTAAGVVLMSLANILKNNYFTEYGDIVIAASAIVGRITMIIGMLQIGITSGIQPAMAYNFGAKNNKRVHHIVKVTAITTFTIGFVLTLCGWIFGEEIITLFINTEAVIETGSKIIVGSLISGPIIGWFYICVNYLQSSQRASLATALSSLRQGVLYIPLLFILNKAFGLMGIVYSNALSDILSTILGIILCVIVSRKVLSSPTKLS